MYIWLFGDIFKFACSTNRNVIKEVMIVKTGAVIMLISN